MQAGPRVEGGLPGFWGGSWALHPVPDGVLIDQCEVMLEGCGGGEQGADVFWGEAPGGYGVWWRGCLARIVGLGPCGDGGKFGIPCGLGHYGPYFAGGSFAQTGMKQIVPPC
jgi:hypothetical protein